MYCKTPYQINHMKMLNFNTKNVFIINTTIYHLQQFINELNYAYRRNQSIKLTFRENL